MKSERRHELQTNSLVQLIDNLPLLLRAYANHILVGVVIVALGITAWNWRARAERGRAALVANSSVLMRQGIDQLRVVEAQVSDPEQIRSLRGQLAEQINRAIDDVLSSAKGKQEQALAADALLARGDLHWHLATARDLPPSTQPANPATPSPQDALKQARQAYELVLDQHPQNAATRVAARFGLAAVHEQAGEFPGAAAEYQSVIDDAEAGDVYRNLARMRLHLMEQTKSRPLIGPYGAAPAPLPAGIVAPAEPPAPATMPAPPPATAPAPN